MPDGVRQADGPVPDRIRAGMKRQNRETLRWHRRFGEDGDPLSDE
ncbi:hypothetical protein [Streptomyces camelliae]|uniref:Integrase n=1 Tax=Streptomyces camelliae TaxID=3004093 RepID=A0ABY7NVQ9_9ACTN|nr:hypothetical protein [Streptomyces sp. HUAS 2-6]WBO61542.1 hypothetical protein O1G22_00955 [Streptomyces sp. HUAS 2-6]